MLLLFTEPTFLPSRISFFRHIIGDTGGHLHPVTLTLEFDIGYAHSLQSFPADSEL